MNSIAAVIFDLDGTLVNSASGILSSMAIALQQFGIVPARELNQDLIGPPLMAVMRTLTGLDDGAKLEALTASFKVHYDADGYRKTEAFDGIVDTLEDLRLARLPLYIATNKRMRPTQAIIAMLDWEKYFDGIYALDSPTPPMTNKAGLLQYVMQRHNLTPKETLYVGDRIDDANAAEAAQTLFFHVNWGFEDEAGRSCQSGSLDDLRILLQL